MQLCKKSGGNKYLKCQYFFFFIKHIQCSYSQNLDQTLVLTQCNYADKDILKFQSIKNVQ